MNVFVTGGCKNGKSAYAQRKAYELARDEGRNLYYIATMVPTDEEDAERIQAHIIDRQGLGFETIEVSHRLTVIYGEVDLSGVFLLDSVTALLANAMFRNGDCYPQAVEQVGADLEEFAKMTGNVFFVSDYIYGDGLGECDRTTEVYVKGLAYLDRKLTDICDLAVEITTGFERKF